jgi:hypothetical protein
MKKYTELGTTHRTEPCEEYPGEWLVCIPESLGPNWNRWWFSKPRATLGHSFQTFDEAMNIAKSFLTYLEDQRVQYNPSSISICWKCTDNDPRIGECWFTGFFMHGRFNLFGDYRTT